MSNILFSQRQHLNRELKKIPSKNKLKFYSDLYHLIEFAQKDNYENFEL